MFKGCGYYDVATIVATAEAGCRLHRERVRGRGRYIFTGLQHFLRPCKVKSWKGAGWDGSPVAHCVRVIYANEAKDALPHLSVVPRPPSPTPCPSPLLCVPLIDNCHRCQMCQMASDVPNVLHMDTGSFHSFPNYV